jgi:hypothetical protein
MAGLFDGAFPQRVLPPSQPDPAGDLIPLGMWLAPNLTGLLTGQPAPPLPNLPSMPGKVPLTDDPRVAGAIGEAANIGIGLFPLPGVGPALGAGRFFPWLRRVAPEAQALASKSPTIYNPPPKPPRPFEADYPGGIRGAPTDVPEPLAHDIEGNPLAARYVVGRRMVGGADQGLRPAEYDALATDLVGGPVQVRPARGMAGILGRTNVDRLTGRPTSIELRAGMRPDEAAMVYAHELGHVINRIVGRISTKGLEGELEAVYNSLNNPNRTPGGLDAASWARPVSPQALGYKGDEIPREYIVEAIRAYLTDPNYLKTVAPNTAAAIRAAVNPHPTLSKVIQFNTIAGLAAAGLSPQQIVDLVDSASLPIPKQAAPVASP